MINKHTPGDILDIDHPSVKFAVTCWKSGTCTWEQALLYCVVTLSREVRHLKTIAGNGQLVDAANESIKLQEPVDKDPLAPMGASPVSPDRIAFFKEHGHWPEGLMVGSKR